MRSKILAFGFSALIVLGIGTLLGFTRAADKPVATAPSPHPKVAPATPAADADIPSGHRLIYRIVRDHAIAQHARDKGITRAAARDKADHIHDSTLHEAVKAAGVQVKDLPVGDKLEDFLNWIVNHQDTIIAITKIFITLLALLG